jgi:hypothetical protein
VSEAPRGGYVGGETMMFSDSDDQQSVHNNEEEEIGEFFSNRAVA